MLLSKLFVSSSGQRRPIASSPPVTSRDRQAGSWSARTQTDDGYTLDVGTSVSMQPQVIQDVGMSLMTDGVHPTEKYRSVNYTLKFTITW